MQFSAMDGCCLKLGLFGVVRVCNPKSWINIPMTGMAAKMCKNTYGIEENYLWDSRAPERNG